ncbi:MAG: hydroxymethylbilane synthase [Porphyromonadaceae bacterium]|nr:hydroxymethylbilane synthase [Porphyromonadaceae bacterium]
MNRLVIGTRGSRLALYQAELVRSILKKYYSHIEVAVEIIRTKGDRFLSLALDASGDKGLFTKELEEALFAGQIDIAVHSLKDLPVDLSQGTALAAILEREVAEDVLLGRYKLSELPEGAVVGTSSRRRVAQLRRLRPDLVFRPIRGNVETRIGKMKCGEYDAIVMALAGIRRLGLEAEVAEVLPIDLMVSAPGQAAIAVQALEEREELYGLLSVLHCERTERAVNLERSILQRLGGGCAMPLGVHCREINGAVELYGFYQADEFDDPISVFFSGEESEAAALGEHMLRAFSLKG